MIVAIAVKVTTLGGFCLLGDFQIGRGRLYPDDVMIFLSGRVELCGCTIEGEACESLGSVEEFQVDANAGEDVGDKTTLDNE